MHIKRGCFGEEYEDSDGAIGNDSESCEYRRSSLESKCFE